MLRGSLLRLGRSSTVRMIGYLSECGRDRELTIGPTVHWWKDDWFVGGGVKGCTKLVMYQF